MGVPTFETAKIAAVTQTDRRDEESHGMRNVCSLCERGPRGKAACGDGNCENRTDHVCLLGAEVARRLCRQNAQSLCIATKSVGGTGGCQNHSSPGVQLHQRRLDVDHQIKYPLRPTLFRLANDRMLLAQRKSRSTGSAAKEGVGWGTVS